MGLRVAPHDRWPWKTLALWCVFVFLWFCGSVDCASSPRTHRPKKLTQNREGSGRHPGGRAPVEKGGAGSAKSLSRVPRAQRWLPHFPFLSLPARASRPLNPNPN